MNIKNKEYTIGFVITLKIYELYKRKEVQTLIENLKVRLEYVDPSSRVFYHLDRGKIYVRVWGESTEIQKVTDSWIEENHIGG